MRAASYSVLYIVRSLDILSGKEYNYIYEKGIIARANECNVTTKMMRKSDMKKIIIGAVIALCVLIASSIWVISSMKSNSVDDFEYNNLADGASSSTSLTQIDRIIQNSNNTEDGNDNM